MKRRIQCLSLTDFYLFTLQIHNPQVILIRWYRPLLIMFIASMFHALALALEMALFSCFREPRISVVSSVQEWCHFTGA